MTAESQEVKISIKDDGIGIESEMLDAIFDKFIQANQNSENVHGGLGIGLSVTRELVRMHGGTIKARSNGKSMGSEFIVTLPLAAGNIASAAMKTPPSVINSIQPYRILIVDDNVDSAESLCVLLGMTGNETRMVHDGAAALKEAKSFRPDIIILDIGLPGMSGHEVAKHIRSLPELPQPLLVALTGWGQEEDRRRSREAGFDYHLTKPAGSPDLERVLHSWLITKRRSAS